MISFVRFFYIYEGGDDDDDSDGDSGGDGGGDNHLLMPSFISSLNSLHAVKPSFRFRSNARLWFSIYTFFSWIWFHYHIFFSSQYMAIYRM